MNDDPNARCAKLVSELRRTLHELNNALTPVLANAQLARLLLQNGADTEEEILQVAEGATRATAIVRRLQDLARSLQEAHEASP